MKRKTGNTRKNGSDEEEDGQDGQNGSDEEEDGQDGGEARGIIRRRRARRLR